MNVTENTEIRHLHASIRNHLADILDMNDNWKSLASIIIGVDSQPLYKNEALMSFAASNRRKNPGCRPTLQLLDDWGTRGRKRPTVRVLLDYLIQAEQFRAADYLAVDILQGEPPKRPGSGPAANVTPLLTGIQRPPLLNPSLISTRPSYQSTESSTWRDPDVESPSALNWRANTVYDDSTNLKGAIQKLQDLDADGDSAQHVAIPHINFSTLSNTTMGFRADLKLGEGGFGAVYLGHVKINGKEQAVAIKRLNVGEEEQFLTELHVMARYVHENLLPILGFSSDNPQARCLVCAYMANGSVEDRLALKHDTAPLPWDIRINIAIETAKGLVALHTMKPHEPLVHRDIKSANILLDENFVAKIGDFGIARLGSDWRNTTKIITSKWRGTPVYMADEALRGSITVKMDTFSFGVVLLELLTGLPPFDNERSERDLLSYIEEEDKQATDWQDEKAGDWPEHVANTFFLVATKCTARKKKDRPLMEEILPELEDLHKP